MRTLAVLFVAAALVISAAVAQEPGGKAAKEEKPVLKSVSCAPECGFMVRSHDEKELSAIVIEHSKRQHNKTITEKEVKALMKTEAAMPAKPQEKKY
jgi:predicted small metal-binding protein